MEIQRAYKVELKPNKREITLLMKHVGTARFTWNWGLARRNEIHKKDKSSTNAIELHRELNLLKKIEFSWMYEVSKCAPQEALRDLDKAFSNYFRGLKTGEKIGFPKFKKKNRSRDSFRLTGMIYIDNNQVNNPVRQVKLPRLGYIRLKEIPKFKESTHIQSVTISRHASHWFISFTVTEDVPEPEKFSKEVSKLRIKGMDVGLIDLVVLSDGYRKSNSKPLKNSLRKLRKLNKELSRQQKKSKNWLKTLQKLEQLHYRIYCLRRDILHKLSSKILENTDILMIEDLNIKGMIQNRKLARSISDVGWGELVRQLEYKAFWQSKIIHKVDRFFPSSKLCSNCGYKKADLKLSDRLYECGFCGLIIDRDLNAAINLKKRGSFLLNSVAMSYIETQNACGAGVRQVDDDFRQKVTQMMHATTEKQEVSINV